MTSSGKGPLAGITVVELAAIGPVPHAAMMLADHGADVVTVIRPGASTDEGRQHTFRGRRYVVADLKSADDHTRVLDLIGTADVLLEGFRPGVVERLGLGPDECRATNPGLVYARMTGWGQSGPMATTAGHDINYLSLTGVLHAIGPAQQPIPPVNLLGDFGGGSMMLVAGVLMALVARARTGAGTVLDVAMVDGVAVLAQHTLELRAAGDWVDAREANLLDGGAPFYRCYPCSDGRFVAVGAIEEPFYRALTDALGLDEAALPSRHERANWPELTRLIGERISTRTRDEWVQAVAGSDACLTPVLTFVEAAAHPHLEARGTLSDDAGTIIAAPAPRFLS